MKRCPKCERFGLGYDPSIEEERCTWRDCLWVNEEGLDTEEYFKVKIAAHGTKFKKFADAITKKTSFDG